MSSAWDPYQMYFPASAGLYPGYPTPLATPLQSPSEFYQITNASAPLPTSDDDKKKKSRRYKTPSPQILRVRRSAANERERRRMDTLNVAYDKLRTVLPEMDSGRRLSKFETLQMAQQYIECLAEILRSSGPPSAK